MSCFRVPLRETRFFITACVAGALLATAVDAAVEPAWQVSRLPLEFAPSDGGRAVHAADFDGDGAPDLLVASGERLFIFRGTTAGSFEKLPTPRRGLALPESVDFLDAGDFDADGDLDVVAARHGRQALFWMAGDGRGGLGSVRRVELPGRLTAIAGGEINRRDGLVDLVAAVSGPGGPQLLVFESPRGALAEAPEATPLHAPATDLVLGRVDGDALRDAAWLADGQLVVLAGRDRKLSHAPDRRRDVQPASLQVLTLPERPLGLAAMDSVAMGSVVDGSALAVRHERGWLRLRPNGVALKTTQSVRHESMPPAMDAAFERWNGPGLVIADGELRVPGAPEPLAGGVESMATLRLPGQDALTDVVFIDRQGRVKLAASRAVSTFLVNSDDDLDDGSCSAAHCSLREALLAANASPGADAIHFAIGSGPATIRVDALLPVITEPVTVDATTQPGWTGSPIVELDGTRVPASGVFGSGGLSISAGSSVVRGLVINRFFRFEILIDGAGNNVIEGNYLGTDLSGTTALGGTQHAIRIVDSPGNLVGGSTAGARNVISPDASVHIEIAGALAAGNQVRGNYLGLDPTGTTPLDTPIFAINVRDAPDTLIADNVTTSASATIQIGGADAAGSLVQGNILGLDRTGTVPFDLPFTGAAVAVALTEQVLIGGTFPGAGNLISDRGTGVGLGIRGFFETRDITVQGNFIGTDITGTVPTGIGSGIRLEDAADCLVGGAVPGAGNLIAAVDIYGIFIYEPASTGNTVQGNRVGTDVTGTLDLGAGTSAMRLLRASNNLIGGTTEEARNLFCCHDLGIEVQQASGNTIQGNYVGTDASGSAALPNRLGLSVQAGSIENVIGGQAAGAGNLISGNTTFGVQINGGAASTFQFRMIGNRIGTQADGVSPLGNGDSGILLSSQARAGEVAENVIAFNGGDGIQVDNGSRFNTLRGNSIRQNAGLGIDLFFPGVTPNDPGDFDATGGNQGQNFPELTAARSDGSSLTLAGVLDSRAATQYLLEFFANAECDPSGHGEGDRPLGTTQVTTDAAGSAAFELTLPVAVGANDVITATATDPAGNTSEFSACGEVTESRSFVVDSTGDGGDSDLGDGVCDDGTGFCTLRAALEQANARANAGAPDPIHFAIPQGDAGYEPASGIFRIRPGSELPEIVDPAALDATTQLEFTATPVIVLDGIDAGAGAEGLVVTAGNTLLRGLVIQRFDLDGVRLSGLGGNVLEGNFVGTDATGTQDRGNGRIGVLVRSPGNRIGGDQAGQRNLLSGNDNSGVTYDGDVNVGNLLAGNLIGTDVTGALALGNGDASAANLDQNRAVHLNNAASGVTVLGNVISGNAGHGVFVNGGDDNAIEANRIGTNGLGDAPLGNALVGVLVRQGTGNRVAGNLVSANLRGITVTGADGAGNRVQGNTIGTDLAGTAALPGQATGVTCDSPQTLIGGSAAGQGNLISGHGAEGILISNTSATGVRVLGNRIGTTADGSAPLGNGSHGVLLQLSASGNTVGENIEGGDNLIAFNAGAGVVVTSGARDNAVQANAMHSNGGLGIDLGAAGVTANDPGDVDDGANGLQNFPRITGVTLSGPSGALIEGELDARPQASFTVELFSQSSCDPSGHGEGERFLGSVSTLTDAAGLGSFAFQLPAALAAGDFVTATATDAAGNTSEFSACFEVSATAACFEDGFEAAELDPAWTLVGVGNANQVSGALVEGGRGQVFALTADGATAFYGADNAGFLYQPVTGDFRLETRIDGRPMTSGGQYRKAGLMVRASLDRWDIRLLALLVPFWENSDETHLQFVARESFGTPGRLPVARDVVGVPRVLDLAVERTGQVLSVQYSLDDRATWITPTTGLGGSIAIAELPETLLVGLGMVSNNISVTSTAHFDDVAICQVE